VSCKRNRESRAAGPGSRFTQRNEDLWKASVLLSSQHEFHLVGTEQVIQWNEETDVHSDSMMITLKTSDQCIIMIEGATYVYQELD